MKKITLIRHAKSSWDNLVVDDFERSLNKRGQRDAPFMGKLISTLIEKPDLIITSHAVRALETAKVIADHIGYPKEAILISKKIYMPDGSDLIKFISKISSTYNHIVLVGHNPSITEVANFFTNSNTDNIPTCGIVHINLPIHTWDESYKAEGQLIFFEYPKKYL